MIYVNWQNTLAHFYPLKIITIYTFYPHTQFGVLQMFLHFSLKGDSSHLLMIILEYFGFIFSKIYRMSHWFLRISTRQFKHNLIQKSELLVPIIVQNISILYLVIFFRINCILHQNSCINIQKQNSVAEKKNCHLLDVARALMFSTTIPKHFWRVQS